MSLEHRVTTETCVSARRMRRGSTSRCVGSVNSSAHENEAEKFRLALCCPDDWNSLQFLFLRWSERILLPLLLFPTVTLAVVWPRSAVSIIPGWLLRRSRLVGAIELKVQ